MKKTFSITLTVLLLLVITISGLFNITAGAQTYGYYKYTVSNGEATITDCSLYIIGKVVLPKSLGGYPITNISSYAFYNCRDITSITIPESVISIGKDAFYGCDKIENVNVTNIAAWCNINFENTISNPLYFAKNLYINDVLVTDLIIPDGVKSIGKYAFCNCQNIENIMIPDTITNIGYGAFSGCINLSKVNITDIAAWSKINFGSIQSNPLHVSNSLYINNILVTDITFPDSVTSISAYAFYNCTNIKNIIISNNVTSVGFNAFGSCSNLESITLPFIGESLDTKKIHILNIFLAGQNIIKIFYLQH